MIKSRIEELLDFDNVNVVVLGDVMLDKYITGKITRISPEAPVPVVSMDETSVKLGGAANVAKNVSSLGAKVSLIGLVGDDQNGRLLINKLDNNSNIGNHIIIDQNRKTTSKTRILSQNQHILRIDDEETHFIDPDKIKNIVKILTDLHNNDKVDILIFQDYNKGFFSPKMIETLVNWAKENAVKTSLDPKKENISCYKNINLFKPNLKEFTEIIDKNLEISEASLIKESTNFLDRQKCDLIILTLSGDGIFISNGSSHSMVPTVSNSIVDVSGAGDTVIALASLLYVCGEASLYEIGMISNFAGAAVCNIPGVGVVDKQMILAFSKDL